MAYFANGTEGMAYESQYCEKCIHGDPANCAVWDAHMLSNYEECNNKESILHILIPRRGIENLACRMFVKRQAPKFLPGQGELF